MLTVLIIGIEMLLAFLLQTTIFTHFAIGNITPNILMILACGVGYQFGRLQGMACGFFCGLLIDISSDSVLGVNALFFMLIGYLNGYLHAYYVKHDVFLPLIAIAGSEFLYSLALYVFRFLIRGNLDFVHYIGRIMLPNMLYTTVVAVLLYPLVDLVYYRIICSYHARKEENTGAL